MSETRGSAESPRFRAKIYAYRPRRWAWAYEVVDMRPLRAGWKPGHVIAGRTQFDSQPEALRAALATLENLRGL